MVFSANRINVKWLGRLQKIWVWYRFAMSDQVTPSAPKTYLVMHSDPTVPIDAFPALKETMDQFAAELSPKNTLVNRALLSLDPNYDLTNGLATKWDYLFVGLRHVKASRERLKQYLDDKEHFHDEGRFRLLLAFTRMEKQEEEIKEALKKMETGKKSLVQ